MFWFAEISVQSAANEIKEDWKPTFLCNEEFAQLMLEVLPYCCFKEKKKFVIALQAKYTCNMRTHTLTSCLKQNK